ncbi:hypothetical protein CPB85DRAFT_1377396 [Mucidula mucida]|nr:hypothetical protein CPB85DRAFT_1377396 [Mucidula mucida]
MGASRAEKELYFETLKDLLAKFGALSRRFCMHQICVALRGKGVVLMGKNTMVRPALRSVSSPYQGKHRFVFTSGDLKELRDLITANKVAAPAHAGAFAPKDVTTSFFQALGIPTTGDTIEIISDVKVVVVGTRVGTSEAILLNMLNIFPLTYGMTVVQIFDNGNAFPPSVLDVDEQALIDHFVSRIKTVPAISLTLNYPTIVLEHASIVLSNEVVFSFSPSRSQLPLRAVTIWGRHASKSSYSTFLVVLFSGDRGALP